MDDNPAKFHRAMELHRQGDLSGAEKLYRDLLQRNPTRGDLLYMLGLVALAQHKHQRAADLIGRAIKQNSDFAPAYCNRAIALVRLGRHAEARVSYDKAIALQPGFAEAYYNRGVLSQDLGRFDAALIDFDQAIALRPDDPDAHNNRGNTLNTIKRHAEALVSLERAVALRPRFAAAISNRGNALVGLKRLDAALASFDEALAIDPDMAAAWCNRGDTLHELGRHEAALASYDKAITLQRDLAEAWYGRSLSLLQLGRYEDGFQQHEWRKKRINQPPVRSLPRPLWQGKDDIRGRTLFIHPELRLGDMIQFCRYAGVAERRGAKVILAAAEPLRDLLATLGSQIEIIGEADRPSRFDLHCPLMSLPLAFKTTRQSIPADVPYLHVDPERTSRWQRHIGPEGFKIGICWQGSVESVEMDRAFPLAHFRDMACLPGVRLISLQTGDGSEQLGCMPDGMKVEDLPGGPAGAPRPFVDTAAIMANLDLIITPDTAIAHLAGALGRPAWVALKHVPDWRWGLDDRSAPWYPTLRLFRQQARGDWAGVFERIRVALAELTA